MTRDEAIKAIRTNLKRRSKTRWSVRGDSKGTAWAWIRINVAPGLLRPESSCMYPGYQRELATLLGLQSVSPQGVHIPGAEDFYQEYVDRSAGLEPSVIGRPYWD